VLLCFWLDIQVDCADCSYSNFLFNGCRNKIEVNFTRSETEKKSKKKGKKKVCHTYMFIYTFIIIFICLLKKKYLVWSAKPKKYDKCVEENEQTVNLILDDLRE